MEAPLFQNPQSSVCIAINIGFAISITLHIAASPPTIREAAVSLVYSQSRGSLESAHDTTVPCLLLADHAFVRNPTVEHKNVLKHIQYVPKHNAFLLANS